MSERIRRLTSFRSHQHTHTHTANTTVKAHTVTICTKNRLGGKEVVLTMKQVLNKSFGMLANYDSHMYPEIFNLQ